MKYTGPIYRPPYEANTLLLQVTVGCAHNKCTFCTMYKGVKFSFEKMDSIEADLQEAKALHGDVKRVFLVNGDAFVLSANKLKEIAKMIHKYLPKVEVITMYASINNIMHKTDEQLKELRELKINYLWVGAETGDAETLEYLNKGATLEDSYEQLERLNKANISFYFGFMYGAAGRGKGIQNAEATAKIINATKPYGIVPTSLGTFGNSQLAKDVKAGIFQPATELELIEEQKKLIELVDVKTKYLGIHALNTFHFDAELPRDRDEIIRQIDIAVSKMDPSFLNSVPIRESV